VVISKIKIGSEEEGIKVSKLGKAGIIVFFLLSVGVVISALKIVGNIEQNRKTIEQLNVSLEKNKAELTKVKEEKTTLQQELKSEKELKEKIQRELSRKINELQGALSGEKAEKIVWQNKFKTLMKQKTALESKYRNVRQTVLNLQDRLKKISPKVQSPVAGAPSTKITSLPSRKIGGEVMIIAKPFLTLALNKEAVAGLQPALSVYQRGRLIQQLSTRGVRYATVIVRVSGNESLKGIRDNDRIKLSLSPGVKGLFTSPGMKGKILDVIRPGFLNIDLGREGLDRVQPILLVYRGGELFRRIRLAGLDHLTISVETVAGTNIRAIRKRDIVQLTP
jgi:hypothetical protein